MSAPHVKVSLGRHYSLCWHQSMDECHLQCERALTSWKDYGNEAPLLTPYHLKSADIMSELVCWSDRNITSLQLEVCQRCHS